MMPFSTMKKSSQGGSFKVSSSSGPVDLVCEGHGVFIKGTHFLFLVEGQPWAIEIAFIVLGFS